ncbi:MAG: pyruvate, phosphate dikinase [Acidimicrobiaceae bacterium]|jgi:pyruvate, orthophosphate dikinase|nr:pyruvate, phosphate dikinase [Acidimicrobiaceae bacterium]MBT5579100.1 pyruvate, phosphate dikinase [Acidimicrobiaceae bacterium]MBT5849434.1 pyruvate, phosphate dikinase [Acidimicrobiaceae bacterium]
MYNDLVWITDDLGPSREAALDRLGGKGTALAEMAQDLDLPVPPAFVVTTDVCREYMQSGWPDGLNDRVREAVEELGSRCDRRFGDPGRPMLVAVRSGAPVSMPGMMDTVLNVGINPEVRDGMARETGRPDFAAQTWLRFCRMYATTVLEMDPTHIDDVVGVPADADMYNAAAERLRHSAEAFGGIPIEPHAQVRGAVEAVLRSWNCPRARLFRKTERIDEGMGTAVVVQAMVFGNLDEQSGTGVIFTRNPANGRNEPYGDYLTRAQGEDVVAGTHEVNGLDELATSLPAVYQELLDICDRLEHHYRDMCDVEFTIASGHLYILQTRVGRRSPEATVRIAAQMAEDPGFPLTRGEAVERIDHGALDGIARLQAVRPDALRLASGIAASPGVGSGVLSCDPDEAAELARRGSHVVLVRAETSPSDVHGMVGAAGLVTSLGGVVSHAAVVARSWGIPAVTGAKAIEVVEEGIRVDGRFIASGTTITVDGGGGGVFEGDQRVGHDHDVPELDLLRRWARELGCELGELSAENLEHDVAQRAVDEFDVIRALQLKGFGSVEATAHALNTDETTVETVVDGLGDRVNVTPRGVMVTPQGREWLAARMVAEQASADTAALLALYAPFLALNLGFKQSVSDWQLSDQAPADREKVTDELRRLHQHFSPILDASIALVGRLAPYAHRFGHALEALTGGDMSMLASPLKDSYHTVWFEYHEEMIHLVGRTRLEEELGH